MRIGGKWICDPRRIISLADEYGHSNSAGNKWVSGGNQCLVYISGGNAIEFSNSFLDYSLARMIEIHDEQVVLGHSSKIRQRKKGGQQSFGSCEVHIFIPAGLVSFEYSIAECSLSRLFCLFLCSPFSLFFDKGFA